MKKTKRQLYNEEVLKIIKMPGDLAEKHGTYMKFLETQTILKRPERARDAGTKLFKFEAAARLKEYIQRPAEQVPLYQWEYLDNAYEIVRALIDEWNYRYRLTPWLKSADRYFGIWESDLKIAYARIHPELVEADELLRMLARYWAQGMPTDSLEKRFCELVHNDMKVVINLPVVHDAIYLLASNQNLGGEIAKEAERRIERIFKAFGRKESYR